MLSLLAATGIFLAGAIIRALIKHRNAPRDRLLSPASYEDSKQAYGDPRVEPSLTGNGYHYAPYHTPTQRQRIDEQRRAVPRPAACTLTTRDLEHVNVQRRLQGRSPLNRNGFKTAIASARTNPPVDGNNWLPYLIAYELLTPDHVSSSVSGCAHISIDPGQPFNGQGGEFAGAGASGSWAEDGGTAIMVTPPAPAPDPYAAMMTMAASATAEMAAASLAAPYGAPAASVPDSTPAPSAPDTSTPSVDTPSSSSSYDSGPSSSSFDSGSSSSSFDSGSSSSSDSGGGF
jgi:hypothetical protein